MPAETHPAPSPVNSGDARELYLDLLIKALTGMIYADPPMDGAFDAKKRRRGADWPSNGQTMIGLTRMRSLRSLVETVLSDGVPGDLLETGVWRGGACILMRGLLAAHGDPARKVYVCDSFRGLPPPRAGIEADEGSTLHTETALAVSKGEVAENFRRYGLLDERVVFVEGYFEDTLAGLDCGPLAILRLDGDMYSSTMAALEPLYDKVSPGGYVIVDDYFIPACRGAVEAFRTARGIDAPIVQVDWSSVWWRKPA